MGGLRERVLNELARGSYRHRKNAGGWCRVRSFNELKKHNLTIALKLERAVELALCAAAEEAEEMIIESKQGNFDGEGNLNTVTYPDRIAALEELRGRLVGAKGGKKP